MGNIGQNPVQHLVQVHLLVLHAERIIGLVGQHAQIEFGDDAVGAVAELPDRRDAPVVHHRVDDAELAQIFQRRRMEGGGAPVIFRLGLRFQQQHRYVLARQGQGGGQAGRAAAGDDDALFFGAGHGLALDRGAGANAVIGVLQHLAHRVRTPAGADYRR